MEKAPLILILLGKSGSGKGTQVNLLKDKLGLDFLGTGALLRERKKTEDFSGKKISDVIDNGCNGDDGKGEYHTPVKGQGQFLRKRKAEKRGFGQFGEGGRIEDSDAG